MHVNRMNKKKVIWRSRHIKRETKGALFKSWAVPIFLYGSETWPIQRPKIRRKVKKCWNMLVRRAMNIRGWSTKRGRMKLKIMESLLGCDDIDLQIKLRAVSFICMSCCTTIGGNSSMENDVWWGCAF